MEVLSPISGFPAWGSDKGTGNPRESGLEGLQDLIIGLPKERETDSSLGDRKNFCIRKDPEERGSDPTGD